MSNPLQELKDTTAQSAFGMTKAEAVNKGVCLNCKQPPKFYSYEGRKEYGISGLCEYCFDDICDLDRCQVCGKSKSWHEVKAGRGECNNFIPMPPDNMD